MTKPPVKLGVGKKFLEKRKEPPSGKMKLVWQPQHFNIGGSMSMNDVKSLSHSKWRCKYHIVFAPKYRRQIIYGRIKADVGKILRDLCKRKKCRDNRSGMLSGSYSYASNDTTTFKRIEFYGIFKKQK